MVPLTVVSFDLGEGRRKEDGQRTPIGTYSLNVTIDVVTVTSEQDTNLFNYAIDLLSFSVREVLVWV